MSANTALSIIAVIMIAFLVIGIVVTIAILRTLSLVNQLTQRAEQELNPLIFDLRLIVADVKKISETAQVQAKRVDHTIQYLSHNLMDAADAAMMPVYRARMWSRALSAGMRYFFRRG